MAVCSGHLLVFSLGQDAHQYIEVWPPPAVTVSPWYGDLRLTVLSRQEISKATPSCGAAEDPI